MTATFKRCVLACYLSVLMFMSLNPWVRPESGGDIWWDKIDHAVAYAGLAILVFSCSKRAKVWHVRSAVAAWPSAMMISFLIGAALEIAQSVLTVNRSGSLADVAANAMGVLLGFVVFMFARFVYVKWSY